MPILILTVYLVSALDTTPAGALGTIKMTFPGCYIKTGQITVAEGTAHRQVTGDCVRLEHHSGW